MPEERFGQRGEDEGEGDADVGTRDCSRDDRQAATVALA
jgi:hypothetical protein